MAKEIINNLKLIIQAGKANPAPPIGPTLGQNGIPIQEFCNEFNNKTKDFGNDLIPVTVTVYKDRTFKLTLKQPIVSGMLKNKAKISKGSATPNKEKVGSLTKKDLLEIAKRKLPDLNTDKLDSAVKIVEGTAKSLGIEIKNN